MESYFDKIWLQLRPFLMHQDRLVSLNQATRGRIVIRAFKFLNLP